MDKLPAVEHAAEVGEEDEGSAGGERGGRRRKEEKRQVQGERAINYFTPKQAPNMRKHRHHARLTLP